MNKDKYANVYKQLTFHDRRRYGGVTWAAGGLFTGPDRPYEERYEDWPSLSFGVTRHADHADPSESTVGVM